MDFTFEINHISHPAKMTNIYSLVHLNIHNFDRMQLFVLGLDHHKIDIIKRVYQLSLLHIQYHGQNLSPTDLSLFHFSFTGPRHMLEKIRSDLGIKGKDIEEQIEDPDEEVLLPLKELAGLNLSDQAAAPSSKGPAGAGSKAMEE